MKKSIFAWWYAPLYSLIELVQALASLASLTLYRPNWTVDFALWYFRRRYSVYLTK